MSSGSAPTQVQIYQMITFFNISYNQVEKTIWKIQVH